MGTLFSITLYAKDRDTASAAAQAGFGRVADLDQMMTDYRDDSELMRLCAQPAGKPVRVSEDLFDVLERAAVDARRRPETLTLDEIARICRAML